MSREGARAETLLRALIETYEEAARRLRHLEFRLRAEDDGDEVDDELRQIEALVASSAAILGEISRLHVVREPPESDAIAHRVLLQLSRTLQEARSAADRQRPELAERAPA